MGTGLVAVRTRLEGAPESLYCVGRSCIRWQLVQVPDGLGEDRITEGLTARSFLIKTIFASSPAVVGLDILVALYGYRLSISINPFLILYSMHSLISSLFSHRVTLMT